MYMEMFHTHVKLQGTSTSIRLETPVLFSGSSLLFSNPHFCDRDRDRAYVYVYVYVYAHAHSSTWDPL